MSFKEMRKRRKNIRAEGQNMEIWELVEGTRIRLWGLLTALRELFLHDFTSSMTKTRPATSIPSALVKKAAVTVIDRIMPIIFDFLLFDR